MIELRGLREWLTVGSASVYYILTRLEQQELLTRTQRADSDPGAHGLPDHRCGARRGADGGRRSAAPAARAGGGFRA